MEDSLSKKTDERGRVFYGDLSIAEGSGRVPTDQSAGSSGSMELSLVAEVAGLGGAEPRCAWLDVVSTHHMCNTVS